MWGQCAACLCAPDGFGYGAFNNQNKILGEQTADEPT